MAEIIENGIHAMSEEKGYIVPDDEAVKQKLEWFKDQKLGLMMHWAPASQLGIVESWSVCEKAPWDKEKYNDWAQKEINWIKVLDKFRKDLKETNKTFNPIKFSPERWARLAKECGFKYLLFTTKHHDGFCMYDSKYSDYKITSPDCPFHKNENADIVKSLYNAFRNEGLGISVYFSKPDWNCDYYWSPKFKNEYSCNANYDPLKEPELWEKFVEYTHNQIRELTSDYGKVDVLWLDGGCVSPKINNQDIHLEKLIPEIRSTTQKGLIVADRTVGGKYENILTPEQTVPEKPINAPWESCITVGDDFSYHYDCNLHLKSPAQIIHTFLDIVCKGGNLALNITPQPDGELPEGMLNILNEFGLWLKINGEGIFGSRPCYPYSFRDVKFTEKDGAIYAFAVYKKNYHPLRQVVLKTDRKLKEVISLRTKEKLNFKQDGEFVIVDTAELPLYNMKYAEGFKLI